MEQLYIGIDMGGTKCAVVAGHADGKILRRIAFPSGKDAHPDEFLPRFYEAIDALLREYNGGAAPAAVGEACASEAHSRSVRRRVGRPARRLFPPQPRLRSIPGRRARSPRILRLPAVGAASNRVC